MTRLLFISTKNRWFFRLTLITTLLAFACIILGTFSRLSGATFACPDWPLCYGQIIIPHTPAQINAITQYFPQLPFNLANVQIEMTLRFLLTLMTLAVISMTFTAYRLQRQLGMQPFMLCLPVLVTMMLEIFLSKLTATQKLHPSITLLHLLVQLNILGFLWWIGRISRPNSYSFTHPTLRQLRPWAWLAFAFVVLQIIFGGWINLSAGNAACASFPYCNIQLTPAVNWNHVLQPFIDTSTATLASLHTLHRLGALLGFLYLALFSFILVFNRYIYHVGFTIFLLVCLQFTLGILHVGWLQTPAAVICQNGIVALMLLAIISLLTNLYNKPQDYLYG